ncbi:tubulin folding cofactor D C terminal-domain-containing protein [Coniella lustricola]|uniref:Tubulin folding cofactor D C terminal-domain-containing protein n=1 Tax=Coniella lustricola TaxID=2025994 RepID=A0A2T3AKR6_9PEZI|nr:tubulin folding cofactor D C terminal-domain-containing protein [Coniella lustricola]
MDAAEEELDIKLQKVSSELISAFDQRLGPFLRKPDGAGGLRLRSRVRAREAFHLMSNLLDPFQELPQLLDPHLPKWLPFLAEAFLEHLQRRQRRPREATATSSLLMPLPTAVCKLIYTFCKIRGEKVIVRFLNVETRYLELLLSALEDAERTHGEDDNLARWTWEERYIVLLWLSHLMFAPFDLSTISSIYMEDVDLAGIRGFFWPSNVPGITVRILPLAVKYLDSPGKERDAAKALLVRMAMRRDMQQLGVLHALVQWALYWLRPRDDEPLESPYKYIGVLSFLAGILASSAETSDMEKYSSTIFYAVDALSTGDDEMFTAIRSSALAKKTVIKIMRSVALAKLNRQKQDEPGLELVEATVGHLLESLADNDTPVRLAASKALSIITLKLPPYMATEVLETVFESLDRNVLLVKDATDPTHLPKRDLTSVDPLEWHGLMLTLSHLLYRRSPPTEQLGNTIRALLLGLSFERRSPSGGSIGTNVRDAACFGIWALARRYSTAELLDVPYGTVQPGALAESQTSVLQILATNLVVAASLDPAGNIRRGSSAALQELIGRHPDQVANGIAMVQAVDYHSVALRSRAIHDVAVRATKLHVQYGTAILAALLGWRGAGDADAGARRVAGLAYGKITAEIAALTSSSYLDDVALASISRVVQPMKALQTRQVEERHGLLMALASILDQIPSLVSRERSLRTVEQPRLRKVLEVVLNHLHDILQGVQATTFRKPELIAEGVSRLLISAFPVLQAEHSRETEHVLEETLISGPELLSSSGLAKLNHVASRIDLSLARGEERLATILSTSWELLHGWLAKAEVEVINAASEASIILLLFSTPQQCEQVLREWAEMVRSRSRSGTGAGYFCALTRSYPVVALQKKPEDVSKLICGPLLERWAQDTYIDVRAAILQSLIQSEVLKHDAHHLFDLIAAGLEDYTSNARGDVGSHVRLQAIRATKHMWVTGAASNRSEAVSALILPILRLAAEKLDRVRVEAQGALAVALESEASYKLSKFTFSSRAYFTHLLALIDNPTWLQHPFQLRLATDHDRDHWTAHLLAGYVTSADTGNEDLVIASRAALTAYCDSSQAALDRICTALLANLRSYQGQGQDRVVVPTLEIIAFLFLVGVYQRCATVDVKSLCLAVQKAGYQSGNVRKLEACIKVYGGLAGLGCGGGVRNRHGDGRKPTAMASAALTQRRVEGIAEARKRLGALASHPWPRVRNAVIDEMWILASALEDADLDASTHETVQDRQEEPVPSLSARLKGVDWAAAPKGAVKTLVTDLGFT